MRSLSFLVFFLCIWTSLQWCEKFKNKQSNQIISVSHSMDNFYLAVAIKDTNVKIYSLLDYKLLKTYTFTGFKPQKVRFSQDGKYLGIAYDSNNVKILNALEPFDENLTLAVDHNSLTNDIDFDSTGGLFLSCGADNKIKLWTIVHGGSTWTPLRDTTITAGQIQTSCRFSPTNTYISHSTMSNLYTYTASNLVSSGSRSGKRNKQAAWSRDDTRVYSATSTDTKVYQYIRSGFGETNFINGDEFYTIDVSPNGKYLITGGKNKVLYFFNQTSFNHTMIYQMTFPDQIRDAKFSKDSKKFSLGLKNSQFYVYSQECLEFCQSGYIYIQATQTCQKCSKIITNCSICDNSTYCKECQVGFYFDKNTKSCSLCNIMQGCSICSLYNQCTSCAPGYAMNSTKNCEKCSKFLTGCNVCNSTTICVSCLNEYYLDTTTNKCKLCQLSTSTSMNNCLRCNSSSTCIQCMPGYFADSTNSNRCSKCSSNCLYCENSASNCSQCTLGYYVNPPISYTCTACSYGCLSCNASGYCFDCMAQMYQATDGTCQFCPFPCTSCQNTTYCQKCIDHYFLNQTDNKCYRCENNCNTCNSSTYCVSCVEGYYLRTSDNTCQLCSVLKPYCTQCNSTQCISCVKGFYYSSADSQCIKCISKMYECVTCTSATVCKQCTIGYYLTTNSGNSSCASCPKQCQACNTSNICTKCYAGFYLQVSNNTCMSCQADHCTQCITKNQCTYCEVGYYLQVLTKTCLICSGKGCYSCVQISGVQKCELCLPGYYIESTSKTCKQCNNSCTTCLTSATQCTSCSIGYFLDSTAKSCNVCPLNCSQCNDTAYCTSCSYGYYLDNSNNKCFHCTQKYNKSCLHCNATNCLLCKSGFYLTNTPLQVCKGCNETDIFCLQCSMISCTRCDDGAYLDSSVTPNKCKLCSSSMQGCFYCSSSNTCTKCQNGYYLDLTNNKCKLCQMDCQQCISQAICTKCNSHYYLQPLNTSCVLCQSYIKGCSQCPTNTQCQQCQNGFYLKTIDTTHSTCQYCSQSIAGCQYCNSSTICTKCLTQYYLDSTIIVGSQLCSKCATAMPGCQLCTNAGQCIKCESGYYLDGTSKLCSLCQVKLEGCVYCSTDGSTCNFCNTGYYLSSTTNKCVLCSSVQTGCEICNQTLPNQLTCLKSRSGFYLKNTGTLNQSIACDALYCDICYQSDPTKCITCDSAFYLESSTQSCISCKSNLQACLTCSSSSICTSCQSGYFLNSNNKCSTCTSKFDNCFMCNQSQCLKCKSLYILNPLTSGCQTCFQKYPGCKYCNQTDCFYCSSNYYKSGNNCLSCDTINGCLACDNAGVCLKCKQNYYQDPVTKDCQLCSTVIQGCFACQSAGICVLCQSGYMVNENKTCTKLTASNSSAGQVKKSYMKLATEYVSKDVLKHSLYSSQYDFSKIDLKNNITQIQLFMKYTANSLAIKQPLTLLSYQWSTSSSKLLYLYSNNPLNVSSNKMTMFRRLLQSPNSSISLQDTTVSVSIPQALAQEMLPQAKFVSDTQVKYDLSDPGFYASYIKQSNMQMWQFIVFGYIVIVFLVINYTVRSFWTDKNVNSDHGEMILHYLSFAAPCLIIYPTTVQVLSFCYGFMLLNFPWMNDSLGRLLGNSFDNSPAVMKIMYVNLNIGSTYAIALATIVTIIIIGYSIISISNNNHRNQKPKEQNKSIFFNLIYNIFSYGAIFTSALAIQGCFMNPINELLSFENIANSLFYIAGILMLFLIFVDLFHSLCIDPTKYFYKLRNLLKTILLSLSHFNPTYFFSVLVIMDFLFVAGEYFISKKQNSKTFAFSWITKNIALNVGLILLVFFSNKMVSVIVCICLILLCVGLQIYEHCKLGSEKRSIEKLRFDPEDQYQRAADRTINTDQQDEDKLKSKAHIWNLDTLPETNVPQYTHTPIKSRPPEQSSRKQHTMKNELNMTSIDTIFQSTDYEPRRRRDRKRQPMKNTVSSTLSGFKGMVRDSNEKVVHVKKKDRYDAADENLQKISDF